MSPVVLSKSASTIESLSVSAWTLCEKKYQPLAEIPTTTANAPANFADALDFRSVTDDPLVWGQMEPRLGWCYS